MHAQRAGEGGGGGGGGGVSGVNYLRRAPRYNRGPAVQNCILNSGMQFKRTYTTDV